MNDFLAGALTATFLIASVFFFKFWRRTHDRLFSIFSISFLFFALNQIATSFFEVNPDQKTFVYLLRIVGYILILLAIAEKNRPQSRQKPPQ